LGGRLFDALKNEAKILMSKEMAHEIGAVLLLKLGELQQRESQPPIAIAFVVLAPEGNYSGCASHCSEDHDLELMAMAGQVLTLVGRKYGN
jgi:hypothetical protein